MLSGGDVGELRRRFLALHDARKVRRAEDAALLTCALAVYEGACARRERAQEAVLRALDAEREAAALETEWAAIVHGLALVYARSVDRDETRSLRDHDDEPNE
jgi:hypothetical protein